MYAVKEVTGGKLYHVDRELYAATVYYPKNDIRGDIINLGFNAGFYIVMPEKEMSDDEVVDYAISSQLAKVAASSDAVVVFVYPKGAKGWEGADEELYKDLISISKIGPAYEDGVLINEDFFKKRPTTYCIRGAIFRTVLIGFGKSADYIATKLCKTIDGQYLWGPGEITVMSAVLSGLTVTPTIERRDLPIVSVNNSEAVNEVIKASSDYAIIKNDGEYIKEVEILSKYKRWCGTLVKEPDLECLDVIEEYGIETVITSPDNCSEFKETANHEVGYFAWYNKCLLSEEKVPTVMVFHGGGDSALHIAKVSGWWEIAHKYNFLLIAVENHLNVTATETVELLEKLKQKYHIDENRIYASGFSMGGCKTWDLIQEYPEVFAAYAPMDATFDVGLNLYGNPAPKVNREVSVPVFYAGGEITPLPELPFQAEKCFDRIEYVFDINKNKTKYDVTYDNRKNWTNPIWGIDGDRVERIEDKSRNSMLTINFFTSGDGVERTALASISEQGHECRQHTCEYAWLFMSKFIK